MSEAHKRTLEELNAAIRALDFDRALTLCTDDTRWTFEGDKVLEGREAVRQWMIDEYREPPDFEVEHVVAEGEFLVAIGTIMVKDEAGLPTRHRYSDVWRFRSGRLAELHAFVVKAR